MYDYLVKDLRENHDKYFARDMQAADAIEKLSKDLERSKEWETFWEKEANEALKKFQTTVASIPRWIPVTERPPEEYKAVLLLTMSGEEIFGYYDSDHKSYCDMTGFRYLCTHWMPRPKPPKEE